jgi:hypothetical protein
VCHRIEQRLVAEVLVVEQVVEVAAEVEDQPRLAALARLFLQQFERSDLHVVSCSLLTHRHVPPHGWRVGQHLLFRVSRCDNLTNTGRRTRGFG